MYLYESSKEALLAIAGKTVESATAVEPAAYTESFQTVIKFTDGSSFTIQFSEGTEYSEHTVEPPDMQFYFDQAK